MASEYMFGVNTAKLSEREQMRRDRICREEGGYGYTQMEEGRGQYRGWFSGPNYGEPFDSDLRRRVLDRINR